MKFLPFIAFFFGIFTTSEAATFQLDAIGYPEERELIERLYAKDFSAAKSMPTNANELEIQIGTVDLNGDGFAEIMAMFDHPYFCGAEGCTLLILSMQKDRQWKEIGQLITHGSVEIFEESNAGYKALAFDSGPRWVFQGGSYLPSKP